MLRVEVLYFEGCPNHAPTVARVREVMAECGISAELDEVEVRDAAEAERLGFLGSPSVRINGVDVEPDEAEDREIGFGCRLYGGSGLPSRELLVEAFSNRS